MTIEQEQKAAKAEKVEKLRKKFTLADWGLIKHLRNDILIVGNYALKNDGKILVDDEVAEKRLAICQSNKCSVYLKENKRCGYCGCGISGAVSSRTKYIALHCPLDYNPLW